MIPIREQSVSHSPMLKSQTYSAFGAMFRVFDFDWATENDSIEFEFTYVMLEPQPAPPILSYSGSYPKIDAEP